MHAIPLVTTDHLRLLVPEIKQAFYSLQTMLQGFSWHFSTRSSATLLPVQENEPVKSESQFSYHS